jgi:hypothetical protein
LNNAGSYQTYFEAWCSAMVNLRACHSRENGMSMKSDVFAYPCTCGGARCPALDNNGLSRIALL